MRGAIRRSRSRRGRCSTRHGCRCRRCSNRSLRRICRCWLRRSSRLRCCGRLCCRRSHPRAGLVHQQHRRASARRNALLKHCGRQIHPNHRANHRVGIAHAASHQPTFRRDARGAVLLSAGRAQPPPCGVFAVVGGVIAGYPCTARKGIRGRARPRHPVVLVTIHQAKVILRIRIAEQEHHVLRVATAVGRPAAVPLRAAASSTWDPTSTSICPTIRHGWRRIPK